MISIPQKELDTALIEGCYKGNKEIVELLLKNGANINCKDEYGNTPLVAAQFWAIQHGYPTAARRAKETVKLLKSYGKKK
jgi:hypothetical protein